MGIKFTGYVRAIRLKDPEEQDEDLVPVSIRFPREFEQSRKSEYGGVEISLRRDTRNHGAYSTRGSFLRAFVGLDRSLSDDDADYSHYGLETQLFLDLHRAVRTLALRGLVAGLETDDPSRIPYPELEREGGRYGARGYAKRRFADQKKLLLTAEYRYRATETVYGVLFVDWLAVAGTWGGMRLTAIDPTAGFALNLGHRGRFVSLQVAFGPEDIQFSFGSDTVFSSRDRRLR